ncbi:MAG: tRNA (adenosine(37)-N6)-dimethylallyltransferase MiaA [Cardiobacteriaceae bacterium]|nr:tRNA (adenosine(37)-N6)-dimethylallyltransferase MiaA [Cardiobacteriaceae bacterium]
MTPKPQPLIALIGATATGKTALALELYDRYPVHLINVDATQIYRGMDIGSAKLSRDELARYPHALIDILDPEESYSAAQFCDDATREIQSAWAKGKIPVLVGGTMMYYHALFTGLNELPNANPTLREQLQQRLLHEGNEALWQELQRHDPESAQRISPNDSQRLIRLLELFYTTGEPASALFAKQTQTRPHWQVLGISLQLERALLHERIAKRFHLMVEQGFEEEVMRLKARPQLQPNAPSMKSAGYREFWAYLDGECSRAQAIEQSIIHTRQLAKRQITWQNNRLKSALPLITVDALNPSTSLEIIQRFIENL